MRITKMNAIYTYEFENDITVTLSQDFNADCPAENWGWDGIQFIMHDSGNSYGENYAEEIENWTDEIAQVKDAMSDILADPIESNDYELVLGIAKELVEVAESTPDYVVHPWNPYVDRRTPVITAIYDETVLGGVVGRGSDLRETVSGLCETMATWADGGVFVVNLETPERDESLGGVYHFYGYPDTEEIKGICRDYWGIEVGELA